MGFFAADLTDAIRFWRGFDGPRWFCGRMVITEYLRSAALPNENSSMAAPFDFVLEPIRDSTEFTSCRGTQRLLCWWHARVCDDSNTNTCSQLNWTSAWAAKILALG
jgi:hypothetical protein